MDLATEESALTGESVPTGKDAMAHVAKDAPLADRDTMIYTGTIVVRGRGRAVVTATGANTELGRIGAMIASIGEQKTPLEVRLDAFGRIILRVCLALSAALLAWGFLRPAVLGGSARPWYTLLLEAVALAVAAIPEGLPAITTITLALGMQRMARRGAIVRKLPAVETLGAAHGHLFRQDRHPDPKRDDGSARLCRRAALRRLGPGLRARRGHRRSRGEQRGRRRDARDAAASARDRRALQQRGAASRRRRPLDGGW